MKKRSFHSNTEVIVLGTFWKHLEGSDLMSTTLVGKTGSSGPSCLTIRSSGEGECFFYNDLLDFQQIFPERNWEGGKKKTRTEKAGPEPVVKNTSPCQSQRNDGKSQNCCCANHFQANEAISDILFRLQTFTWHQKWAANFYYPRQSTCSKRESYIWGYFYSNSATDVGFSSLSVKPWGLAVAQVWKYIIENLSVQTKNEELAQWQYLLWWLQQASQTSFSGYRVGCRTSRSSSQPADLLRVLDRRLMSLPASREDSGKWSPRLLTRQWPPPLHFLIEFPLL